MDRRLRSAMCILFCFSVGQILLHQKRTLSLSSSLSSSLLKAADVAVFNEYSDPSTWPTIDNATCRYNSTNRIDENTGLSKPYYQWQRRAPYAILLGTMKGGTRALVHYLYQHPMIARREKRDEEHFFNKASFVRDENGIPVELNQKRYALRFKTYYPKLFDKAKNNNSSNNNSMIAIDNTPYYLFGSERIPSAVLCVAPWAKLLAILRNPVDRVESQYHYLYQHLQLHNKTNTKMVDWEVWVNHDIQLLQTSGVLQDWNIVDFDTFAGSDAEMLAWKRYVRSPHHSMYLVGRGLYAIQLHHWYQAMYRVGKNPASDLMIIHSEAMRNSTQSVYNNIIQFLDLPPFILKDPSPKHETKIKSNMSMPESIRKTLEKLYEPYNQRLYKMLGWDNVWDYSTSSSSYSSQ